MKNRPFYQQSKLFLDPGLFLKELNFKTQSTGGKGNNMFTKLRKAMRELKLHPEFTKEDFDNAVVERQIRVDYLSTVISPLYVKH